MQSTLKRIIVKYHHSDESPTPLDQKQVLGSLLSAAATRSPSLCELILETSISGLSIPWTQFSLEYLQRSFLFNSLEDLAPMSLLPDVEKLCFVNSDGSLQAHTPPSDWLQQDFPPSRKLAHLMMVGSEQFLYWTMRRLSCRSIDNISFNPAWRYSDLVIWLRVMHFIFSHYPDIENLIVKIRLIDMESDIGDTRSAYESFAQSKWSQVPPDLFSAFATLRGIKTLILENVFFQDPSFILQLVDNLPYLSTLENLQLLPVPLMPTPDHAMTLPTMDHLSHIAMNLPNLHCLAIRLDCSSIPAVNISHPQGQNTMHPLSRLYIVPSRPLYRIESILSFGHSRRTLTTFSQMSKT